MDKVIDKIENKDGSIWYAFFCQGCKCSHHFTDTWKFNQNYESPTVMPSILVNDDLSNPSTPRCHLFIRDGVLIFLSDCTHELAGQNIEMIPI